MLSRRARLNYRSQEVPVPLTEVETALLCFAAAGITGVTVILQDVTRLRRFDEIRSNLVASLAHEIDVPLGSVRMAIHACIEGAAGELTPKQLDILYAAREDCDRMQNIVEEFLDLA